MSLIVMINVHPNKSFFGELKTALGLGCQKVGARRFYIP